MGPLDDGLTFGGMGVHEVNHVYGLESSLECSLRMDCLLDGPLACNPRKYGCNIELSAMSVRKQPSPGDMPFMKIEENGESHFG